MQNEKGKRRRRSDWYSVSVDSVRLWLGLGLLVATGVGAYGGYQQWSSHRVERKAFENVAKSERLGKQLREETGHRAYLSDLELADQAPAVARREIETSNYRRAAAKGQESFDLLQDVSERLRQVGSIAWFRSVEGDVRYRRGETGEFLRAYPRGELHDGDYVRSSNSASAEIHFRHEDTVFTVRPKSLIKLSRDLRSDHSTLGYMEYGWVRLDTAATSSALLTPYSELRVDNNSKASLELPQNSKQSTIKVSAGTAEVRSLDDGAVRRLGERQQVIQSDSRLGRTVALPEAPLLASPADDFSLNIDDTDKVRLEWSRVAGAARYALQVSRGRLFGDNEVDVSNRSGTRATLGITEQGKYGWRVAAYSSGGALGPWSETRSFRVASYRGLGLEDDDQAPSIDVDVMMNGAIALLTGKTEPGAHLEMNGEEIPIAADGSFTTTRVLYGKGRIPLDFEAKDRAGNRTKERRWVYLDEG